MPANFEITNVLRRFEPVSEAIPLILDSPHSGACYPQEFNHALTQEQIRWGEDAFIDELFADAPKHGAWLMAALFPRSFIDPNRALIDLDTTMIEGDWPDPVSITEKTDKGIGLIWRRARPGLEFYDRKLTVAEVRHRIDTYWQPYHDELTQLIEAAAQRWGKVWHLNCHSMPSAEVCKELGLDLCPSTDIVLGDRDGTTANPEFTETLATLMRAEGLSVAINDQLKGVELVRKFSAPEQGRNSVQIEINRNLYMDEYKISKSDNFASLQATLDRIISATAAYVKNHL